MTLRSFLFWTVLLVLALAWYTHAHYLPPPGVVAQEEPLQAMLQGSAGWPAKNSQYTITPLATYDIHARVLSRKDYHDDRAWLDPTDLALAWGRMSDSANYGVVDFSQRGRFLIAETGWKPPPIPKPEFLAHVSNNHIIPANDAVAEVLASVRRHDVVKMHGALVEVRGPNGFCIRSSLTRTDTGNKACEVFWVSSLTIEPSE